MGQVQDYEKLPVKIQAIQLRWDTWSEVCDFVDEEYFGGGVHPNDNPDLIGLNIKTTEGIMLAEQDDYIIKGIKGEFYPCKPDVFEKTYKKVEPKDSSKVQALSMYVRYFDSTQEVEDFAQDLREVFMKHDIYRLEARVELDERSGVLGILEGELMKRREKED